MAGAESKGQDCKGRPGPDSNSELDSLFEDKGYEQLYVVLKSAPIDPETKRFEGHEVLFQCGKWCYSGTCDFGQLRPTPEHLPLLIPSLQRQQSSLRYFCNSSSIPGHSPFAPVVECVHAAAAFFAAQMVSEDTDRELAKLAKLFPWVDADAGAGSGAASTTYFELSAATAQLPDAMQKVAILALKRYVRGLVIIAIYHGGTFYFMVQSGEGEQALLDLRFPDVSKRGEGMHLASYTLLHRPWEKLTLWHLLDDGNTVDSAGRLASGAAGVDSEGNVKKVPVPRTLSLSSGNYQQTYCVLRSAWEGAQPKINMLHESLFRFGSWCYCGRVQLTPTMELGDIPYVIPALRMQQSLMSFLCAVDAMPATSLFAPALEYLQSREALIESVIEHSIEALEALIDKLSRMGLGDAVAKWIDGEENSSFFEFKIDPTLATREAFKAVEVVANKTYHASGIITKSIFYNYTLYVMVEDGSSENPLLDSTFPDVSGKGRGYQIFNYADAATRKAARAAVGKVCSDSGARNGVTSEDDSLTGHPAWPELKKVSIWQTTTALEQEFRERASVIAQKNNGDGDGIDGGKVPASSASGPSFKFGAGKRQSEAKQAALAFDGTMQDMESLQQSTQGASEMPLPRLDEEESTMGTLSLASEGSLMPSGTAATLPLHREGKDWQQNTVVSSIADVGTGTIVGSTSERPQPKLYNADSRDPSTVGDHSLESSHQSGASGNSVVSASTNASASGASTSMGSCTYASNITPGGSWRSMGSIRGGSTRGGLGGRGLSGRGIVTGTSGSLSARGDAQTQRDVQGNALIGSNYQHSEGFDIQEFSRNRQGEFVRDTMAQNAADMKAIPSSSHSLGARIQSFVNSYSKATDTEAPQPALGSCVGVGEGGDDDGSLVSGLASGGASVIADESAQLDDRAAPKVLSLNEISGIKSDPTTTGGSLYNVNECQAGTSTTGSSSTSVGEEGAREAEGEWDTVGRAVRKYEDKMAASRSEQVLQTQTQLEMQQEMTFTSEAAAAPAAAPPRDDKEAGRSSNDVYANADAFNAAFHDACLLQEQQDQPGDYASVSTMGQLSARSTPFNSAPSAAAAAAGAAAGATGGVNANTSVEEFDADTLREPSLTASQELLEPSQTTAATAATGATGRISKYPSFTGGIDYEYSADITVETPISWGAGSGTQARPHHIPKMNDALSDRLDTIKKTMTLQPYQEAPWDTKGMPIKKKKQNAAKKKDAKASHK